jgi:Protein of unknown function (DUF998)
LTSRSPDRQISSADEPLPELSVHGVGAALAFTGMAIACLVFARRFTALRRRGWVAASVATAVSTVVIASWPGDGISIRLVVATAILFAYLRLF